MQNPYKLEKLSKYFADDKNQIKDMITLFLDTIPPDIKLLEALAEKEEWHELLKITHRIKPSIDVFEMNDILKDIITIEKIARKKNLRGSLNICIKELAEKFDKINKLMLDDFEKL